MRSIHVLRKPCSEPTVAANVLRHGTGGINVDGSRIGTTVETWPASRSYAPGQMQPGHKGETMATGDAPPGRWPANLLLGACIDDELDEVFPHTKSSPMKIKKAGQHGTGSSFSMTHYEDRVVQCPNDEGSAARYFKRVGE